jgi:ribosome-binding factor A
MTEGKRSDKVADLIRKEVSDVLMTSVKDPRIGFVTVTRVAVSDDCRQAKVYFSVMGTAEEQRGSFRDLRAQRLRPKGAGSKDRLRYTRRSCFSLTPRSNMRFIWKKSSMSLRRSGGNEGSD